MYLRYAYVRRRAKHSCQCKAQQERRTQPMFRTGSRPGPIVAEKFGDLGIKFYVQVSITAHVHVLITPTYMERKRKKILLSSPEPLTRANRRANSASHLCTAVRRFRTFWYTDHGEFTLHLAIYCTLDYVTLGNCLHNGHGH